MAQIYLLIPQNKKPDFLLLSQKPDKNYLLKLKATKIRSFRNQETTRLLF
jgi:hypothetical protein